jgi:hypothetical protein
MLSFARRMRRGADARPRRPPPAHYLDLSNHTGVLSVPQGGTGATTVEGARAALGEAPPRQVPLANSLSTVESAGNVGLFTSITIGTDGLPVISYFDGTNSNLKVAKCANASCLPGFRLGR